VQQGVSEHGTSVDEVLAVVQDEEELLGLKVLNERLAQGASRRLAHPYSRGNCLRYQVGVRERGQPHPPRSLLEALHHLMSLPPAQGVFCPPLRDQ
jgi:hypothetical protein